MVVTNPISKPDQRMGNHPLLLGSDQVVWLIKSGSVALFSSLVNAEKQPVGSRRYFFSLQAGDILLGQPLRTVEGHPEQTRGFIAVALEEVELKTIPLSDFFAQIQYSPNGANQLERWFNHWNQWLAEHPLAEINPPTDVLQLTDSHYVSLIKAQGLALPEGSVRWIQVQQGTLQWLGMEHLIIEPCKGLFPIMSESWIQASSPTELTAVPSQMLENVDAFLLGAHQFYDCLGAYIHHLEQQQTESEFQQFQDRERLNQQVNFSSMRELISTIQPGEKFFLQKGSPLLVAAGAVGHTLGIPVLPPAQSEDFNRLKDPLDAIARASKFQTRRVLLTGKWWEKEHGSLLSYKESGEPIALLQEKGNRYVLFDPEDLSRTPIDEGLAETLSLEAYMFYPPLPKKLEHVTEIFHFATRGHLADVFLVVLMGVTGSLLGMVVPQATSILINEAIPGSDHALLWQLGLALLAAAIGKSIFEMAQGILSMRVENVADSTLQPAVWDRLLQLHPSFFRDYATGDLLLRLLSINQIRAQVSGATQRTLLNSVFALLNLALMVFYSVKLALVGIGVTVVIATLSSVSSLMLVRKSRRQEELDGKINGLNVELMNGVAKLRVAAAEERAFGAWVKLFSQRTRLMAGIQRINDSVAVLTEAIPLISSALIYWFAILFIEAATKKGGTGLTIGTFLAFNSAFGIFLGGVVDLSNTITDILEIVPLWERAQPIIQGEPETDLSKADPGRLSGRILLDHITFRYREDGPLILEDVTVEAEPGEFIALVGPSGSGKSTLMRILLGFETPLSGTVYLDNQDLSGLDVQSVRRQLGVVLQNGRIGAGSVFENITGGALVSLDEAWAAARMAGFEKDIKQMPMGMHTVVSEGGTNLSGGQRQRLLIARSIVLKPTTMILDEATSALDNQTQAIVTESLDDLNATRIVIAHRLSTIRNADRIYVLQSGRVVQVGTFETLVAQDGLFARLASRQLD